MFQVIRSKAAPPCTISGSYNTEEIVKELERIFHSKCYLCEQGSLTDPEIEHFVPHKGDDAKKLDWNNLYYSCSRCNSIKGSTHVDLLDCCGSDDVFYEIKCIMTPTADGEISVSPGLENPSAQAMNTVRLLSQCYNSKSTGLRGITRASMVEQLYDFWTDWQQLRRTIVSLRSGEAEVDQGVDRMKSMLKINFPFSVFWRWHLLEDQKLLAAMQHHVSDWHTNRS